MLIFQSFAPAGGRQGQQPHDNEDAVENTEPHVPPPQIFPPTFPQDFGGDQDQQEHHPHQELFRETLLFEDNRISAPTSLSNDIYWQEEPQSIYNSEDQQAQYCQQAEDIFDQLVVEDPELVGGLNLDSFTTMYTAYRQGVEDGSIDEGRFVALDLTQPSNLSRLYIFDFSDEQNPHIESAQRAAHGRGAGMANQGDRRSSTIWARRTSNTGSATAGSNCPSQGLHVLSPRNHGNFGHMYELEGLEQGVNDNAEDRRIYLHRATGGYVPRSNNPGVVRGCTQGCTSVNATEARENGLSIGNRRADDALGDRTGYFVYHDPEVQRRNETQGIRVYGAPEPILASARDYMRENNLNPTRVRRITPAQFAFRPVPQLRSTDQADLNLPNIDEIGLAEPRIQYGDDQAQQNTDEISPPPTFEDIRPYVELEPPDLINGIDLDLSEIIDIDENGEHFVPLQGETVQQEPQTWAIGDSQITSEDIMNTEGFASYASILSQGNYSMEEIEQSLEANWGEVQRLYDFYYPSGEVSGRHSPRGSEEDFLLLASLSVVDEDIGFGFDADVKMAQFAQETQFRNVHGRNGTGPGQITSIVLADMNVRTPRYDSYFNNLGVAETPRNLYCDRDGNPLFGSGGKKLVDNAYTIKRDICSDIGYNFIISNLDLLSKMDDHGIRLSPNELSVENLNNLESALNGYNSVYPSYGPAIAATARDSSNYISPPLFDPQDLADLPDVVEPGLAMPIPEFDDDFIQPILSELEVPQAQEAIKPSGSQAQETNDQSLTTLEGQSDATSSTETQTRGNFTLKKGENIWNILVNKSKGMTGAEVSELQTPIANFLQNKINVTVDGVPLGDLTAENIQPGARVEYDQKALEQELIDSGLQPSDVSDDSQPSTPSGAFTLPQGGNVWNGIKANLKNQDGETPTDAEILDIIDNGDVRVDGVPLDELDATKLKPGSKVTFGSKDTDVAKEGSNAQPTPNFDPQQIGISPVDLFSREVEWNIPSSKISIPVESDVTYFVNAGLFAPNSLFRSFMPTKTVDVMKGSSGVPSESAVNREFAQNQMQDLEYIGLSGDMSTYFWDGMGNLWSEVAEGDSPEYLNGLSGPLDIDQATQVAINAVGDKAEFESLPEHQQNMLTSLANIKSMQAAGIKNDQYLDACADFFANMFTEMKVQNPKVYDDMKQWMVISGEQLAEGIGKEFSGVTFGVQNLIADGNEMSIGVGYNPKIVGGIELENVAVLSLKMNQKLFELKGDDFNINSNVKVYANFVYATDDAQMSSPFYFAKCQKFTNVTELGGGLGVQPDLVLDVNASYRPFDGFELTGGLKGYGSSMFGKQMGVFTVNAMQSYLDPDGYGIVADKVMDRVGGFFNSDPLVMFNAGASYQFTSPGMVYDVGVSTEGRISPSFNLNQAAFSLTVDPEYTNTPLDNARFNIQAGFGNLGSSQNALPQTPFVKATISFALGGNTEAKVSTSGHAFNSGAYMVAPETGVTHQRRWKGAPGQKVADLPGRSITHDNNQFSAPASTRTQNLENEPAYSEPQISVDREEPASAQKTVESLGQNFGKVSISWDSSQSMDIIGQIAEDLDKAKDNVDEGTDITISEINGGDDYAKLSSDLMGNLMDNDAVFIIGDMGIGDEKFDATALDVAAQYAQENDKKIYLIETAARVSSAGISDDVEKIAAKYPETIVLHRPRYDHSLGRAPGFKVFAENRIKRGEKINAKLDDLSSDVTVLLDESAPESQRLAAFRKVKEFVIAPDHTQKESDSRGTYSSNTFEGDVKDVFGSSVSFYGMGQTDSAKSRHYDSKTMDAFITENGGSLEDIVDNIDIAKIRADEYYSDRTQDEFSPYYTDTPMNTLQARRDAHNQEYRSSILEIMTDPDMQVLEQNDPKPFYDELAIGGFSNTLDRLSTQIEQCKDPVLKAEAKKLYDISRKNLQAVIDGSPQGGFSEHTIDEVSEMIIKLKTQ